MDKNAQEIIKAWLAKEGRKARWIAQTLSVHEITVSQWLNGRRRPNVQNRAKLAKLCGDKKLLTQAWGEFK